MSDIILIPGLWLDGSSWDGVVPTLQKAGHTPHPLTLPGMDSKDADRSNVTTQDAIDAVVGVIDRVGGPVVVVGHSAAAGLAFVAADARPERVSRVIFVGGFPSRDGRPLLEGFPVNSGEIAFPDWDEFDEADVRDLDPAARDRMRARAIPSPGCFATDPVRLTDQRRYDVPATVICPEFTADQLRAWIDAGEGPVQEFRNIRDLEYVDLHSGHWPQFSQPDHFGQVLLTAVDR